MTPTRAGSKSSPQVAASGGSESGSGSVPAGPNPSTSTTSLASSRRRWNVFGQSANDGNAERGSEGAPSVDRRGDTNTVTLSAPDRWMPFGSAVRMTDSVATDDAPRSGVGECSAVQVPGAHLGWRGAGGQAHLVDERRVPVRPGELLLTRDREGEREEEDRDLDGERRPSDRLARGGLVRQLE